MVDKLLSIIALLGLNVLSSGFNPIRQLAMSLVQKRYVAQNHESLKSVNFQMLNEPDILHILSFATSLIEQVSTSKRSQQERSIFKKQLLKVG